MVTENLLQFPLDFGQFIFRLGFSLLPDAGGMETASVGLVILGPAVVAALIGVDVVGCCTAGVVGCTEGCDAGVVAGTTGLTAAGVVGCSPEWSVLFSLPPKSLPKVHQPVQKA